MNIISLKEKSSNSFNPFLINNSHLLSTPCEKVLLIIKEAIKCLTYFTKSQNKLISDLQWTVKTITNHLLYSYEIKQTFLISQLKKENPELKQFIDFVNEYNEQINELNKKNIIIDVKNVEISNRFLRKSAFKLKKQLSPLSQKISPHSRSNSNDHNENIAKNNMSNVFNINNKNQLANFNVNKSARKNISINPIFSNDFKSKNYFSNFSSQKPVLPKLKINQYNLFNNNVNVINSNNNYNYNDNKIFNTYNYYVNLENSKHCNTDSNKILNDYNPKNKISLRKSTISNPNKIINNLYSNDSSISNTNNQSIDLNKSNINYSLKFSYNYISNLLNKYNYNKKNILEKDFNIFELKQIIGYENVLPLMGMVILENLGLKDEKIISINKLELFLQKLSNSYLSTSKYHNSMHGSDVTHSLTLFILNSNIRKLTQINNLDLVSIIIAALGHDVSHPGFSNNYHINALTDLAIVYNDISCLENFHCSTLFSIITKDEYNIFDKLNKQEFKIIRKRMISEILATDMAVHNKVVSLVQEKFPLKEKIDENFKYLSGNEKTIFDEQQNLLNYFIHAADLAHNTKKFEFSIKWVELLINEFWLQGDKERKLNLPISFLCDRKNVDIPSSQIGFITGIILPTFGYLIKMFPDLHYTVDNAKRNLSKWKKLCEEHRARGWTPQKELDEKKENNNSSRRYNSETGDNSD